MRGICYREFRHQVWFNHSALFNGFLHSSYEKTNTSLYLGLSLCIHSRNTREKDSNTRTTLNVFLLERSWSD